MIVVADSGPLHYLILLEEIELLRRGRGGGGGEGHEPGAGERAEENRQQTCAAHADASGRGDGKAFREGRGVYASAAGRAAGG